jgi:hypothetical protein
MADKRISELNSLTVPAAADEVLISDSSATETKKISFTNLFKLPVYTTSAAGSISGPAAGQLIYCSDGDTGNPCLAVYNGSVWKRIALGATIASS